MNAIKCPHCAMKFDVEAVIPADDVEETVLRLDVLAMAVKDVRSTVGRMVTGARVRVTGEDE